VWFCRSRIRRAGRTAQAEQLALVNIEIDAVDRGEIAEMLADALYLDEGLGIGIEPGTVGMVYRV
jgi:hypothetical protein